jgi:hypothetical protein
VADGADGILGIDGQGVCWDAANHGAALDRLLDAGGRGVPGHSRPRSERSRLGTCSLWCACFPEVCRAWSTALRSSQLNV